MNRLIAVFLIWLSFFGIMAGFSAELFFSMNKFNKQFNSKIKRFYKWQDVLTRLSTFEGLVNSYDGLTPNDVRSLRGIHSKLLECQDIAQSQLQEVIRDLQLHQQSMEHTQNHRTGSSGKHFGGSRNSKLQQSPRRTNS